MLFGHDFAWWGFVLAILGIVLMAPVAVGANLLTPKIQNWWAKRSVESVRRRIEKLEKELADMEKDYELLSPSEDFTLRGISRVGGLAILILQLLPMIVSLNMFIILDTLGITTHKLAPSEIAAVFVTVGLLVAVGYISRFTYFDKLDAYRLPRSPIRREKIKESIKKLGDNLSNRLQ